MDHRESLLFLLHLAQEAFIRVIIVDTIIIITMHDNIILIVIEGDIDAASIDSNESIDGKSNDWNASCVEEDIIDRIFIKVIAVIVVRRIVVIPSVVGRLVQVVIAVAALHPVIINR